MICPNCNIEISKRTDGSYRCPQCPFVTFENLEKITEFYTYVAVDINGNEGIIAYKDEQRNMIMPLVSSKLKLINEFRKQVKEMAKEPNSKIRLLKFSTREVLEEFE